MQQYDKLPPISPRWPPLSTYIPYTPTPSPPTLLFDHCCSRHHKVTLLKQCEEVLFAQLHPLLGNVGKDEGQALLRKPVLAALIPILDLLPL